MFIVDFSLKFCVPNNASFLHDLSVSLSYFMTVISLIFWVFGINYI